MSEDEMFKLLNSINTSLVNLNAGAITTNQILVHMQEEINSVSKELYETKTELKQDIADVRTELYETKEELKQDIADVRTELKQDIVDVRTELYETKEELKQDISNVKVELNQNIEDAKTYLCDVVDEMTSKLYEMHNQEIESLKKRVTKLEMINYSTKNEMVCENKNDNYKV